MKIILTAVLLISVSSFASAQTRCQCEYDDWVDDCDAEFEKRGNWITFKSDTEQCSRIDWSTDAQPRLTIVEDGKETVELMNIPDNAVIAISSCKVCKDALYDTGDQDRSVQTEPPAQSKADSISAIKEAFIACGTSRSEIDRVPDQQFEMMVGDLAGMISSMQSDIDSFYAKSAEDQKRWRAIEGDPQYPQKVECTVRKLRTIPN